MAEDCEREWTAPDVVTEFEKRNWTVSSPKKSATEVVRDLLTDISKPSKYTSVTLKLGEGRFAFRGSKLASEASEEAIQIRDPSDLLQHKLLCFAKKTLLRLRNLIFGAL